MNTTDKQKVDRREHFPCDIPDNNNGNGGRSKAFPLEMTTECDVLLLLTLQNCQRAKCFVPTLTESWRQEAQTGTVRRCHSAI